MLKPRCLLWGLLLGLPISSVAEPLAEAPAIRALLVAKVESVLSSQISARIDKIAVENGGRFKKGDSLIEFDCATQKAQLKIALAQRKEAALTLKANRKLRDRKAISHLDLGISEVKHIRSRAEVELKRVPVGYCQIKAPFNGRVIKRLVQPFQTVDIAESIIEILDDSQLKMEIFVPSHWLTWLHKDTAFQVRIDETQKVYPAVVSSMGAKVEAVSQTIALSATIKGEHPELLAGMSGVAVFEMP